MSRIDKLLEQARVVAHICGDELDHYDFNRLSTDELKELVYGDPPEEKFRELSGKAWID